jgi:hypothetical protein
MQARKSIRVQKVKEGSEPLDGCSIEVSQYPLLLEQEVWLGWLLNLDSLRKKRET